MGKVRKKNIKSKKTSTKEKVTRPSRFNLVQTVLSQYTKETKTKLGRDFNKHASLIYHRIPNYYKLKDIQKNVPKIFVQESQTFKGSKYVKKDDTGFIWFDSWDIFSLPSYAHLTLIIEFNDYNEEYNYEGPAHEYKKWIDESGLKAYMRKYYNESPLPIFTLLDKGDDWLKYKIEVIAPVPPEEVEKEIKVPEGVPGKAPSIEKEIELEKIKIKRLELEERVAKEKSTLADKILKMLDRGLSKDDIKDLLT